MTQNDKKVLNLILFLLKQSLNVPVDISVLDLDFVSQTNVIKRIEQILIRHKLVVTVYPSITALAQNDAGNMLWSALRTDLKIHNYKYIKQAFDQEYEIGALLDAFEKNRLTSIPLKGWELRKLYPNATNRSMVDFDILVKDYNYMKVAKVMKQLEFECGSESSWKHDNFSKNNVTVEVHKRLTDDSKYISRWEQTLWDRSKPYSEDSEFIRKMCNEDFYIFHFLHMYKHFCNGALGLRTIVDTWLFLNKYKKLNRNFLNTQFERMGLKDFVERIEHLSRACFETNEFDENDLLLLEYAVTSGVHGDGKRYKLGRAVMKSRGSLKMGALRSKFDAVFLPYSRMKAHFPILKKYPFLLPYCWFKRIWRFRHSISESAKRISYSDVSESDFRKMREYFRAAGVK